MGARLRLWWQQIKQHPYATGIGVFLMLILFILLAYLLRWDWTGFNSGTSQITITSNSKVNYTATISQPSKSLWDWLQLLGVLAIPVVVGLGAAWFTAQQGIVSDRENTDNQRETALQAYFDKMSELLLKEHLGERTADGKLKSEYEQVRKIARIRTITVLTQLDARRIGYVFTFLREAELMSTTSNNNVVSLSDADLHAVNWSQSNIYDANLSNADLWEADLREARLYKVNLSGADLREAHLSGAHLGEANLSNAFLSGADLSGAYLYKADLRKAHLGGSLFGGAFISEARRINSTNLSKANLSEANLSEANLKGAILSGADLSGADLSGANLKGAIGLTVEELETQAASLKSATMPDGTIHP